MEIKNGTNASQKRTNRSYISDVAILTHDEETGFTLAFTHRDRLGSAATFTDHNNQVTARRHFDPFGKPRGGDWSQLENLAANVLGAATLGNNPLDGNMDTRRGFTDHEHLDEAEIIYMNGRVYDYNLGRFLSVDPFIQSPGDSQSINPYSYIMNNPLAGTDPTGYCAAATGTRIKSCGDMKVEVKVTMKDGSTATKSSVVKNVNFKNGADVSSAMSKGASQAGGQFSMADFGGQGQIAKTDPAQQSSSGQKSSLSEGASTDGYITPEGVHDFGTAEVGGHTYNVTATFGEPNSDSGGNPYSLPENMVTVAGLAAGVAERGKHPYWLAGNGKIYPSSWGETNILEERIKP